MWPSKASLYFNCCLFLPLSSAPQTQPKQPPHTFRRSHAPSPISLPRPTPNSVGCCVPRLNGGHLRPRPHPPLSYFSSIYFDDRTDDTAHPHAFHPSRASSLTPPPSLTPILYDCCVLICKTVATCKAQAPPPPSIFRSLCFCPSKRAIQRHRTQAQRLAACAWCWGAAAP